MGIKVWLDDVRPMPYEFDLWARSAHWLNNLISDNEIVIDHISFDHDLGDGENNNGYQVAVLIEELACQGKIRPMTWDIHSSNPEGRKRIDFAMNSAKKYWDKNYE